MLCEQLPPAIAAIPAPRDGLDPFKLQVEQTLP